MKIITNNTSQYIKDTSKEYSIYVCSTRAIPSIEDGLKNGQRMALWLLRNKAEKIKTSALSGMLAAEKIYVHGEASANNAIGLLAAPYKNNVPLIHGIGQFGSRLSPVDGIGAPRYTEVKRSKIAEQILYNDIKDVPMEENYDGSTMQPKHFLPLIPTVLLNGIEGVAVGWSTSILPRSLDSIIDATIDAVKNKRNIECPKPYHQKYDCTYDDLGDNKWQINGKLDIVNTTTVRITELPPTLSAEKFTKRLIDMEEDGLITDFDEHSTDCIDIEIKLKRSTTSKWKNKEEDALKFFKLSEKVTERIIVVGWGGTTIKHYEDPVDLIREFVDFRLKVYETRYTRLLSETEYDVVYWRVLKALFEHGFTKKLGTFKNKLDLENEIGTIAKKDKLEPDQKQIERISSLPTYRWTADFETYIKTEIKRCEADIKQYQDILKDPKKIKTIYIKELTELKKLKI